VPVSRVADRLALLRRRIEEIERAPGGVRKLRVREGDGAPGEGRQRSGPAAAPLPAARDDAPWPVAGQGGGGGEDREAGEGGAARAGPAVTEGRVGREDGTVGGGTAAGGTAASREVGTVTRGAGRTVGARPPLVLGAAAVDAALGGGLARAALHEVAAARPGDPAAAVAFALGVAARAAGARGRVLWVVEGAAAGEAGALYGPGLDGFGLPARRLVVLAVRRPIDALWAMEEGLKTPGLAAVVAELLDGAAADLTASRRLSLAAQAGGGLGLLVAHRGAPGPSAAVTRWRAGAAAAAPDRHGGLGPPAVALTLTRNRRGPCGAFTIEWDSHAGRFADLAAARPASAGASDVAAATAGRTAAALRDGAGGELRDLRRGIPEPFAPEPSADTRPAARAAGPHAGGVAAAAGDRPPRPQAA
jgi:protein ImuA